MKITIEAQGQRGAIKTAALREKGGVGEERNAKTCPREHLGERAQKKIIKKHQRKEKRKRTKRNLFLVSEKTSCKSKNRKRKKR